jgi:hypothetical protein
MPEKFLKFAANQEEKSFEYTIRNIERGAIFVYHRCHACFVAYLLYFSKRQGRNSQQPNTTILGGVRTLYSIIMCFILLSPMIEIIRTRAEKPILIVGIDNSQSIRSNKNDSTEVLALKNELYTALNSQFDLQLLTFGEEIKVNNEPDFSERTSDYSGFINEINKRYFNLNVGAVVLVGDGVYNKGENRFSSLRKFRRLSTPWELETH